MTLRRSNTNYWVVKCRIHNAFKYTKRTCRLCLVAYWSTSLLQDLTSFSVSLTTWTCSSLLSISNQNREKFPSLWKSYRRRNNDQIRVYQFVQASSFRSEKINFSFLKIKHFHLADLLLFSVSTKNKLFISKSQICFRISSRLFWTQGKLLESHTAWVKSFCVIVVCEINIGWRPTVNINNKSLVIRVRIQHK